MTEGEAAAHAVLMTLVDAGFDADRFARLLNAGPGALSDAVWARLEARARARHELRLEQRESLAIVMIEVDLARRLLVARRGLDPRISTTLEVHRTAAFHAMEEGAGVEASGPEAILWFQAASVFFEKAGEPLFQADALSALAGCLHDTLQGDFAANLAQADEILDFAKTRILSAQPGPSGDLRLPEAALERLGWIAFRRALFASRQSRFVGPDPKNILALLMEAATFAAPCDGVEELHEEIRALASHEGVQAQVDLVLATAGPGGVAEQRLQQDLVEALSAEILGPDDYRFLVERLDRFIAIGACGPLSLAELHILRAQIIMAHGPAGSSAERHRASLSDLDIALAAADQESRGGRGARQATLRLRAVARAQSGDPEAALADLEMLVTESEQSARASRTAAGSRGSVELLRALSGFAARVGVAAGHPERGLAIADACRAVGLRALRSTGTRARGVLAHSDIVGAIPVGAAAVSLIPTEEGALIFVTLPNRDRYLDGCTIAMTAEAKRGEIAALSARWNEAYRAMLAMIELRGAIDRDAWSAASDSLRDILGELARTVAGPLAGLLERAGVVQDSSLSLILHGELAQLPLHASGWSSAEGWRCPLDPYVVSYAPSLDFLMRSRSRRSRPRDGGHFLGIFNPSGDLIRTIGEERQAVRRAIGRMTMVPLDGPAATIEAVSAAAPGARAIHFAGHGRFDTQFPGRSGLRLADGVLELDTLVARLDLAACEMLFLSACETSMNDGANMPDEFVGLPNALLSTGCACVIGAAWAVPSDFAAGFAADFYDALQSGELRPDAALRSAVRRARDLAPMTSGTLRRLAAETSEAARGKEGEVASSPLNWAAFALYGVPTEWRGFETDDPQVSGLRSPVLNSNHGMGQE